MNAHQQVTELLEQMLALVPAAREAEAERLTDEISTLVMAYSMPTVGGEFDGCNLTAQELRLVELLHAKLGKLVSRHAIMDGLYFDRHGDDEPGIQIVNVVICKVRRKLMRSDYIIENDPGLGYRMVRKNMERIAA